MTQYDEMDGVILLMTQCYAMSPLLLMTQYDEMEGVILLMTQCYAMSPPFADDAIR